MPEPEYVILASMWRRLALLTCLSSDACGSCGEEQNPAKAPALQKADVGAEATAKPPSQPAQANFVAEKTIRIGLEDTEPIEVIEAKPTPREWIRKDPGKPKVLMSGNALQLPDRWPAARNRGFVEVLGDRAKGDVVETHLVDFETGSMLQLTDAYIPSAHEFGIARASAMLDGEVRDVLLHVQDGHMVPWRHGAFENAWMELHPGTGQVWLLVNDDEQGHTKYSHWTNLRGPPPPPTGELPVRLEVRADHIGAKVVTPPFFNPGDVPILLAVEDDETNCSLIELRSDGSSLCVPWDRQLADGWRFHEHDYSDGLINVEDGSAIIFEGTDECSTTPRWTPHPPRAELYCHGLRSDRYLWSPDATVRVPHRSGWGTSTSTFDGRTIWHDVRTKDNGPLEGLQYQDNVLQRLVRVPPGRPLVHRAFGRLVPITDDERGDHLWLLSLDSGQLDVVQSSGCHEYSSAAVTDRLFAYHCRRGGGGVAWTGLVDASTGRSWRFPALGAVWVQDEPLTLIGVATEGSRGRLLAWTPT